jgi:hypothetical protein
MDAGADRVSHYVGLGIGRLLWRAGQRDRLPGHTLT